MKVAIVHYHLGPGGVTRVIEAASQALATAGIRHVILTGDSDVAPPEKSLPVRQIEGLGYLTSPGEHTAVIKIKTLPKGTTYYAGQLLIVGKVMP